MDTPIVLRAIERADIDRVVDAVHRPVRGFMERFPTIRAALDGSWLGHPLHPAIVPLPIGAWATAVVLDIASMTGNKRYSRAADAACGLGVVSLAPAVLAGLAEFSHLDGEPRRVAFIHATTNAVAGGLLIGSFFLRKAGLRGAGIFCSLLGFGIAGFSAWLGGELSYRYGAGVDRFQKQEPRKNETPEQPQPPSPFPMARW